tara:strand:- start:247 stop:642 length:396 start_codon:yes stop_codon:yes gene_type:complete
MIWKHITEFFDDLFQYHYEKQKKLDSSPEAFPISFISFCQMANFLILIILIYFITDLNNMVDKQYIAYSVLPLFFIFAGINFYKYAIKNGTEKIIARNKIIDKKMGMYSIIYMIFSIWFPLILVYFFNEVF